jgi:hypothetical protein
MLLASCCVAQVLPDTPEPAPKRQTLPHPVALDHPHLPRTVDRGFLIFHGLMFAATAADAYTTTRALQNPLNYENNPLLGRHPGASKVWGVEMGISGGVTFLDYILERRFPHQGASRIFPIVLTVVHAIGAGRNGTKMP